MCFYVGCFDVHLQLRLNWFDVFYMDFLNIVIRDLKIWLILYHISKKQSRQTQQHVSQYYVSEVGLLSVKCFSHGYLWVLLGKCEMSLTLVYLLKRVFKMMLVVPTVRKSL